MQWLLISLLIYSRVLFGLKVYVDLINYFSTHAEGKAFDYLTSLALLPALYHDL